MAAILKSAMLDSDTAILESDTLLSSLRFTQKHSHSTLTLIQTNSIWLMWWWQPSWILPSWIQQFCTKLCLKLIHSDATWWCQTSWILPSWIQPFWTKKNFTHSFWLNLMMSDILNSAILDSAILNKKKIHSFILTQLDDGSHLQFYHFGFSHFAQKKLHSFILTLLMMVTAILNSAMLDSATAILDSDTLLSSLRFTQKHSHSTLTLTQTNSIWLKLIHSHLTWWWQPSWILPSWIWPSWIQPFS